MSANDRLSGDEVCGRFGDRDIDPDGLPEAVMAFGDDGLGFGSGGSVSVEVDLRLFRSPTLRRLSGLANGNSRRGGISCSSVSAKTEDDAVAGLGTGA